MRVCAFSCRELRASLLVFIATLGGHRMPECAIGGGGEEEEQRREEEEG